LWALPAQLQALDDSMADGMFDSGGGSSGGGGGGYSGGHHHHHGSGTPLSPGGAMILLVLVLAYVSWKVYDGVQDAKALEVERQLDKTVYVEVAEAHLDKWIESQGLDVIEGSVSIEPGSSHREGGDGSDYHCKGGQLRTVGGQGITFCCAVTEVVPICLEIQP
jgi:hypothetical protein